MPQFLPRIARYPRPRHSAVQSTSPVPLQTPLPNRCANPQFLSRRQAKPIKEPASRYGLVHRAVYSIPRRADVLLLLGFPPPRNRANLFQSQRFSLNQAFFLKYLRRLLARERHSACYYLLETNYDIFKTLVQNTQPRRFSCLPVQTSQKCKANAICLHYIENKKQS